MQMNAVKPVLARIAVFVVAFALATCFASLALAAPTTYTGTVDSGGATYTYEIKNGEASITGIAKATDNADTTYEAVIPESIEKDGKIYLVTSLAKGVMGTEVTAGAVVTTTYNTEISRVVIPAKLISIGEGAFAGCTALATLEFASEEDGAQHLESVGDYAFFTSGIDKVILPDTVTNVGKQAFARCENVQEVKLPANRLVIDEGAFRLTNKMTTITVPDGCTAMPAFSSISNVERISVPDSVEGSVYISQTASTGKLQTVVLPARSKFTSLYLGIRNAEVNCIPEGVATLGIAGSFSNIELPSTLTELTQCSSANLTSIAIPKSVQTFGWGCFRNNTSLESVRFEEGSALAEIGRECFRGCENLKSIELPDGLTTINAAAFYGTALEECVIPSSVQQIYGTPFTACEHLTKVVLEAGVSSACYIQGIAQDCPMLSEVYLLRENVTINNAGANVPLFGNCPNLEAFYTNDPDLNLADSHIDGCDLMSVYGWAAVGKVLDYVEDSGIEFIPYAEFDASGYNGVANTQVVAKSSTEVDAVCSFSTPSTGDYKRTLLEGVDYTLEAVESGDACLLRVVGNGVTCFGSVEVPAKIDIASATMARIAPQMLTGSACAPTPKIVCGGSTLVLNRDYTLSYASNDAPGRATVIATGIGSYMGTLEGQFNVFQMKESIGSNRVANSLAATENRENVATAILCQSRDYPGIAAASAFSAVSSYPLVVTDCFGLGEDIKQRLGLWGIKDVIAIGGESSCGSAVFKELAGLGIAVDSVKGADASALACAIADFAGYESEVAVLANPDDTTALLSAASFAAAAKAPLYFTYADGTLSPEVQSDLAAYQHLTIIGDAVLVDVAADALDGDVERIEESNACALSLGLARMGVDFGIFSDLQKLYLVSSFDASTFVAYAAIAGSESAPVLVVDETLDANIISFITAHAATLKTCHLLGSDKGSLQKAGAQIAEALR